MARARDAKHELTAELEPRGGWFAARCSCAKWSDMSKDFDELAAYWQAHLVKAGKMKPAKIGVVAPEATP